ncbi:unnamed protein product, partial [marine sediment metagenome]
MVVNHISDMFVHGNNFKIGVYNIIEDYVRVGENTTIKNYVELRKRTEIGDDCYIDSRVSTSGECIIGNNVTLRYASIIARNVIIGDNVFISPQVGFINIPFKGKKKRVTMIGNGVLIGFNATIHDGVHIKEGTIIGAKANVIRDITKAGTYVGNPARLIKPRNSKVKKGKNCILETGVILGSQPFTFDSATSLGSQKRNLKEPKAGVKLGNNVWIGSHSIVMLGMEKDTTIGNNVKIAQLCNIGHDSIIEDAVMISAGVIIGGHARIGKMS